MRRTPLHRILPAFGLLAAAAGPSAATAQEPPYLSLVAPPDAPARQPLSAADSARVLARARGMQSRFEMVRRQHLPWTWYRGAGPCDERVGRFCLTYGDPESTYEPPPEAEPVIEARARLVAHLGEAASAIPGDWWVAGQRVRYLVEAERHDDAITAAEACASPLPGWCAALLGYALHAAGEFVRAETAFTAALEEMPDEERQGWTDLNYLLDDGARRRYRRLEGEDRALFEERFWRLAQPFHQMPGNDRLTEHYSRHVLDRLQERARQTENLSWGEDLRELLIRFGWPAGWERMRPPHFGSSFEGMITRYPSRGADPPAEFVREPAAIEADDWPRRSRSGYAPRYTGRIEALEYQLAAFRRADSLVFAAGLELRPDSLGVVPNAGAALVFSPDAREPDFSAEADAPEGRAVLSLKTPAASGVISLEVLAREQKRAGRARFGRVYEPVLPFGIAISDLLLLDDAEELPESLEEALERVRVSTRVRSGERVGVYWEMYGLSRADMPLDVAVDLVDDNAGWLRRVAVRAGLLRQQTPLTVRWEEVPQEPGAVVGRSLAVELPELRPGSYTLQVKLTARGREAIRAQRQVTVLD